MTYRISAVIQISVLLVASEAASAADLISTWDGTINNWTSNHWSSPNFPNNGNAGLTYDAIINGGTVTQDQDIALQRLTFNGGALTAGSSFFLTVQEQLNWDGGTMAGAGQTIIDVGGSLALTGNNSTGNSPNNHYL